jgi:hypothetical protein
MDIETANEGKPDIHFDLLWCVLLKKSEYYSMALEPLQKVVFAEILL